MAGMTRRPTHPGGSLKGLYLDELVNIEETDWAKRMNRRLLAGDRLKVGLTQKQLAALSGIRQTVISEYETGRRPITMAAAMKLAPHLNVAPETLIR